jgi:hypothetical protein
MKMINMHKKKKIRERKQVPMNAMPQTQFA